MKTTQIDNIVLLTSEEHTSEKWNFENKKEERIMEEKKNITPAPPHCENKKMAETNLFEKIKKANDKMPTIDLKGRPYVQVKDRVVAFRSVFPKGRITTNYVESENYVIFEAIVCDESGCILATGHARTLRNKEKCYEKCESNSVGRALAYIGFGTSESIESYEGMQDYEEGGGVFSDIPSKELLEKFNKLSNTQKANILNLCKTTDVKTIKADVLESLVNNVK